MARLRRSRRRPAIPEPSAEELRLLRRVLDHYPAGTRLTFGAPMRCPDCGHYALVTEVDRARATASYWCAACAHAWDLTAWAFRRAPVRVEAPEPVVVGDFFEPVGVGSADGHLRLLLVEDDIADVELVRAILAPAPTNVELAHAASRREAERLAGQSQVDVVLLDLGLPDSSGLDTLATWRRSAPPAPVVVVSGDDRIQVVDGARAAGASQFLPKQHLVPLLAQGAEGTVALVDFLRSVAGGDGWAGGPAIPILR